MTKRVVIEALSACEASNIYVVLASGELGQGISDGHTLDIACHRDDIIAITLPGNLMWFEGRIQPMWPELATVVNSSQRV